MFARSFALLILLHTLACAPAQTADDGGASDPPGAELPAAQCELAPVTAGPAWLRDGVGYQIWVRSLADEDGDGVGDLRGILGHLDYLNDGQPGGQDLGVDVLWLSPIFASPSDHGYDATDYRKVQPAYGTRADLEALVKACHARGMKVMLDLVLNHCSSKHPWFLEAAQGPGSARRAWFSWRDADPGWTQPWGKSGTWHQAGGAWYYGLFSPHMPDLAVSEPAVEAELTDIAKFWLDAGVDGFRLDAARYLVETGGGEGQADTPGTHAFWKRFRAAMEKHKPDTALVGEVWTTTETVATYLSGDELHATFDFGGQSALAKAVELRDSVFWRSNLCKTAVVKDGLWGRFAGNHDMPRLADATGGGALHKVVLAAVLLAPGTPWIYYGDELALPSGEEGGDRRYRLPMPWTPEGPGHGFSVGQPWMAPPAAYGKLSVQTQQADPDSVLRWVRRLIALRRVQPALRQGPARLLEVTGDAAFDVAVLQLGDHAHGKGSRALLVLNFGDDGAWEVPAAWRQGASRVLSLAASASASSVAAPGVGLWVW